MSLTLENRREFFVVHLVIFLAGFTFLIYEVSWNRLLSLILGATVTASTIVLASFMAGFGAGAYFWGRTANRTTRPGRLLALLLGGIGLLSALDYYLIADLIPSLYADLSANGVSLGLTEVLVFVVATGLLFVPAFLMGGTFPIVSRIAIRSDQTIATSLGLLYALETLGSTIGGLATGFVFLGALGQVKTIWLAVGVNLVQAVWLLARRMFDHVVETSAAGPSSDAANGEAVTPKVRYHATTDQTTQRRMALFGTLVCGFAMLSLQVLWLRMFRIYMTNTSYTFALVASLVILGLFIGSILFQRRGHRITDYRRSMAHVMLWMGALTTLGLLLLMFLPEALMLPFQALLGVPLARVLLLPLVASLLIVLPPAVVSGYAFPLACRMYSSGSKSISRDVGLVLMVNTIGCVVGPIATAFILMPLLGAAVSVILIVALQAGAALYMLYRLKPLQGTKLVRSILTVVIAGLVVVIIIRPDIRILPPSFSQFDREVLFYREAVEGTLSVGQDRGNRAGTKYTYVNNSAVIGSSYDAVKVVKMVGHFPFLLRGECKKVLVIGFGIGVTTSAIASHPEVESIECVELVPGLKDAARYYSDLNHNVVNDPRLKIISGDGRHYLQLTPNKYDLISCDPTHPILGSGNLYTKEYFTLCREHLNPGGVISQYLPLHKLRTEEFMGIISTFHSVFPNCTVWLGQFHAVLLGSMDPMQIDFAQWSERVAGIGEDPHFYSEPFHLAATLMLDGPAIARLGADSRINSDDLCYTEFFAPACLDDDNLAKNLRFLQDNRIPVAAVFGNVGDPERMARFVHGNELMTESLLYQMSGDNQRGQQALREACRVNPEDQEFPFLIRLYY
jgi:spermidine synthase